MFNRIGNLIKAFLGQFISGLEKKNPEALLESEKENLRKQISKYNKGLAAHAGRCERLMTQVKRETEEINDLTAKTSAYLKSGNRKMAGEYALDLQKLKAEHEDNVQQLEDAEKTYEELKRACDIAVKSARDKIDSLKRDISETKIAKATAELNEMAAGMIGEIGGAGDTLNRLEEMVAEERDLARGRARVARDSLDTSELRQIEAERTELEEMALADFAAESGIVIEESDSGDGPGGEATPDDEKTML